jgi:hypothetical protein
LIISLWAFILCHCDVLCRACNAYTRVALYRSWMNMKAITEVD